MIELDIADVPREAILNAHQMAKAMIDEKRTGHWTRHKFDSKKFAMQVLDQLVLQGLEVAVSSGRGSWFLILA